MPARAAERRCAAIVAEFDIPVPYDLGQFLARLVLRRNKVIYLHPFTSRGPGLHCAACGSAPPMPTISSTRKAPRPGTRRTSSCTRSRTCCWTTTAAHRPGKPGPYAGARRQSVPLVQLVLGRSRLPAQKEQEAKTLASLILGQAAPPPGNWAVGPAPRRSCAAWNGPGETVTGKARGSGAAPAPSPQHSAGPRPGTRSGRRHGRASHHGPGHGDEDQRNARGPACTRPELPPWRPGCAERIAACAAARKARIAAVPGHRGHAPESEWPQCPGGRRTCPVLVGLRDHGGPDRLRPRDPRSGHGRTGGGSDWAALGWTRDGSGWSEATAQPP